MEEKRQKENERIIGEAVKDAEQKAEAVKALLHSDGWLKTETVDGLGKLQAAMRALRQTDVVQSYLRALRNFFAFLQVFGFYRDFEFWTRGNCRYAHLRFFDFRQFRSIFLYIWSDLLNFGFSTY